MKINTREKKEVWKEIEGYEGLYEVSDKGNVRSKDRTIIYNNGKKVFYKGKEKSQITDKYGYSYVSLYKGQKHKQGVIHRLVANAFIPKVKEKNHINHIDGIKSNNHAENLEWCTPKENSLHAIEKGLLKDVVGVNHYKAKLDEDDVREIRRRTKEGETYQSLANDFGVAKSTIGFIVRRKTWKHII